MSEDVYRLYHPEWTIAYVTTRGPEDTDVPDMIARCEGQFTDRFAGRVRTEDVRYTVRDGHQPYAVAELEIRMPVLKGEFKFAYLAQRHAHEQGWTDCSIVARNSKADHELRGYGVKLLPG